MSVNQHVQPLSSQPHLTHQPLLVTLGVMEPLDGERCDVFHCQPPTRDPRHGLARVALPRQHLLIHILRGNLGVWKNYAYLEDESKK